MCCKEGGGGVSEGHWQCLDDCTSAVSDTVNILREVAFEISVVSLIHDTVLVLSF